MPVDVAMRLIAKIEDDDIRRICRYLLQHGFHLVDRHKAAAGIPESLQAFACRVLITLHTLIHALARTEICRHFRYILHPVELQNLYTYRRLSRKYRGTGTNNQCEANRKAPPHISYHFSIPLNPFEYDILLTVW